MASLAAIFGDRRRLLLSAIIFAIAAASIILFYFHYLPNNRLQLNEYGFRLLDRIKQNIEERDLTLKKFYTNVAGKGNSDLNPLPAKLVTPDGKNVEINLSSIKPCDSISRVGFSDSLHKWMRIFEITGSSKEGLTRPVQNVGLAFDDLIGPCVNYRNELFTQYLVFAKCGQRTIPVYQSPFAGLSVDTPIDSLLAGRTSRSIPAITEVSFRGTTYYLFFLSVELERQELIVCGLIEKAEYRERISAIPFAVIKRFIMIVLITLISFPFIKIFLLSKDERLRLQDFIFVLITFFIGTSIIALIIIDTLLESATEKRIKTNLVSLNTQISGSFKEEIDMAKSILQLADDGTNQNREAHSRGLPAFFATGDRLRLNIEKITQAVPYYYFDRIVWVDKKGQQKLKAQTDDTTNIQLVNVSERGYFKSVVESKDENIIGFEPVVSWTTGEFRVIISKHSRIDSLPVIHLTTQMYSLLDVIMPAGYGYCLTDESGKVLTHSESERNLRENILNETGDIASIKESMNARQPIYIDRLLLYGQPHAVYVHPLTNTQLYLFTFYNKEFGLAGSVRIISFVVVFTALYYLTLLLLRLTIQTRKSGSGIFPAIDYFEWSLPSRQLAAYFRVSRWISPAYALLLVLIGIIFPGSDDYMVFCLVLLSPVNVVWLMYTIRKWYRHQFLSTSESRRTNPWTRPKRFLFPAVITALSLCIYFLGKIDKTDNGYLFLLFQLVVITAGCAFLFDFVPTGNKNKSLEQTAFPGEILKYYSHYLAGTVLVISILPISLFTWFAHNHELAQDIKKTQFTIARKYYEREKRLRPLFAALGRYTGDAPETKINLSNGIFKINNDLLFFATDSFERSSDASEKLYQSISSRISKDFEDPLGIPALRQYSADSCWYFRRTKSVHTELVYSCAEQTRIKNLRAGGPLRIMSYTPRYQIISNPVFSIPIIIISLLILYAIFLLIKSCMHRLFGYRYLSNPTLKGEYPVDDAAFFGGCLRKAPFETEEISAEMIRAQLHDEYKQFHVSAFGATMEKQEGEMSEKLRVWKNFYECIWSKTDEEERIVLADLAKEGFVNFRQVDPIASLIRQGLIIDVDGRLRLFSHSFRNFILKKLASPEAASLRHKMSRKPGTSRVRTPILLGLFLVGAFLFITQEQTFQKVSGMITGLTSLIPLIVKFFTQQQQEPKN